MTVVFAAGIVSTVAAEVGLTTVAPVQFTNDCPAGGGFAVMVTTVPAA